MGLRPMPGRIEEGAGFFCLDSAYLARKICDAISDKGMTPRIRPKSNTVCKNWGSQAWGDMTRTHREALFIFGDLEHLVFESELYGSSPESRGTAVRK